MSDASSPPSTPTSDEPPDAITLISNIADIVAGLSTALVAAVELERRRYRLTFGALALVFLTVFVGAVLLLVGQARARSDTETGRELNRVRQQCATVLLVEFDAALGNALRVSTQLPRVDPNSEEYRMVIDRLNRTTALFTNVEQLCYGDDPNPNPVPR